MPGHLVTVVDAAQRGWSRLVARTRPQWLLATAPWRALPNTLIIGTQRGGTSSLFAYLAASPDVSPSRQKEVHYFDRHHDQGAQWYRSWFPLRPLAKPVVLEATPFLLYDHRAPERVHRLLPHCRLVVLLRDPVERAYSQFVHERRHNREPLESFEAALAAETDRLATRGLEAMRKWSYVDRGRYLEQLQRWTRLFDRDQLFVGLSEELYADPEAFVGGVCRWLGIRPPPPNTEYQPLNVGAGPAMEQHVRERLEDTFKDDNRRLADWLGRTLPWS